VMVTWCLDSRCPAASLTVAVAVLFELPLATIEAGDNDTATVLAGPAAAAVGAFNHQPSAAQRTTSATVAAHRARAPISVVYAESRTTQCLIGRKSSAPPPEIFCPTARRG
jgi:hypothetical protein